MSRQSNDLYKIVNGVKVLWHGYDYEKQCWVYEGEKDIRTLEQLQSN